MILDLHTELRLSGLVKLALFCSMEDVVLEKANEERGPLSLMAHAVALRQAELVYVAWIVM